MYLSILFFRLSIHLPLKKVNMSDNGVIAEKRNRGRPTKPVDVCSVKTNIKYTHYFQPTAEVSFQYLLG